ncbi:hypothetical protein BDF14DRAFT_1719291 [Spinellus fusiger]|nr:hypothetical protein BDF14DRAFT_1719291 [Spinellus fusiger]
MKKYGPVGVAVYLTLSVVDVSLTMAALGYYGAERIKQAEEWTLYTIKHWLGISQAPPSSSSSTEQDLSFGSLFIIAYGIHKTLLLPFRISLTAAITPLAAKRFKQLGWLQQRNKKV